MSCAWQEKPKGKTGEIEPLHILFVSKYLGARWFLDQTQSSGTIRAIAEGHAGVQNK